MENRARFNLADAVENWKKSLSDNYSMTSDNIEELESHLLDEIDDLKSKGLNEEEAFSIAIKQIGTKDFLVSEFGKVNVLNRVVDKLMPLIQCGIFKFSTARLIVKRSSFSIKLV